MSDYKKLCIAADGTDMDTALYAAVKQMDGSIFHIEHVHILYVQKTSDSEKRLFGKKSELADRLESDVQQIREKIKKQVSDVFGQSYANKTTVRISSGSPPEKVLEFLAEQEIDCLIVGKKRRKKGSGRFAREFLRHTETPVLLIPDRIPDDWTLQHVLIPFDFSKHSEKAVAAASVLRDTKPDLRIECFCVLDYPMFSGKRNSASDPIIAADIRDQTAAFDKRMDALNITDRPDLKIQVIFGNYIAEALVRHARKGSFNLVIMGAVGHSAIGRIFLGSVAEQVIAKAKRIPVLIMS